MSSREISSFLERHMPLIGEGYQVNDLVYSALMEINVSPARFEIYVERAILDGDADISFETSGTVPKKYEETLWEVRDSYISEKKVGAEALYFGGPRPIRFLRRMS